MSFNFKITIYFSDFHLKFAKNAHEMILRFVNFLPFGAVG